MNWKSAFLWTIIIFVVVVFAGYFYHDNRVEEAYSAGWNDSYLAGLEKLKGQLDALSAEVEGLKQKQSAPSYQPPVGDTFPSNWDFWDAYDYKQDKARQELDDLIDFATNR